MSKKRFATKAILALLVVIMVLGSVSIFSLAADTVRNEGGKYGQIIPTDSKLKAQKSSYTFYGDSGKLYFMRISKAQENAFFAVEIFSDSGYQNKIRSFESEYDKKAGNKPLSITWNFKDVTSGKYYGRCYTFVQTGEEDRTIDSSSYKKFEININRVGKKEVKLKSIGNSVGGPVIKWDSLPTGVEYYVYRKEVNKTGWSKIATVGEDVTAYKDTKAKSGKTYTYTVRCYDGKYTSLYNKSGLKIICLDTPVLKSVDGTSSPGNALIKWNKVTGAKGYYVYRKGGSLSDYSWKKIATIKSGSTTSYTDKTARSTDWNYNYTIKAYNGKSYSGHDTVGLDFDYIPAPKLKKVAPYYGGMKLEWSLENENVVNYYVYRKEASGWKKIGTTRNQYFIDTTAVSNKSYTYTVKALSDTNCGGFNSKGISAKYIATPEIAPITFNNNNASVVKWDAIKGAAGYKLYRKINDAEGWTQIATIKGASKTSYTDTVAKESGDKYTYTVRAYDASGKMGYFMPNGVTATFLAAPDFYAEQIPTDDNALIIGVLWEQVTGADFYNVYRRLPQGEWELVAEKTTELVYCDTDVKVGTIYEYAVRALTEEGDISKFDVCEGYAITIPEMESVIVEETQVKLSWTAIEGADAYAVYRQEKGSESWAYVGSSTTNELEDTFEDALTKPYYYTVCAFFGSLQSKSYSGMPNFVELQATASFDKKTNTIAVDWKAPEGAVITLEKSVEGEPLIAIDGEFANEGTFTDDAIIEGNTYVYVATATAEGKISSKALVSAKYPHPPLDESSVYINCGDEGEVTYKDGIASVELVYTPVEFADEYHIIRVDEDEVETTVAIIDASTTPDEGDLFYTDTDIPEGTYTYKVKAVATKSDRESSVSFDDPIATVYDQLDALYDLRTIYAEKNEDGKISVTLSWAHTENAEKYTVYRKPAGGSEWGKPIAEIVAESAEEGAEPILKTTYTDNTVEINTKYDYKVVASAENRGKVEAYITDYEWVEEIPEEEEPTPPADNEEENGDIVTE